MIALPDCWGSTAPSALRRRRSASVSPPTARPPTRRKLRRERLLWRFNITVSLSSRATRAVSHDLANERCVLGDDSHRPAVGREQLPVGVDAEQVIQGSPVADRRVVSVDDAQGGAVGGAQDHALSEATPGDEDELRRAPVI